MAGFIERPAAGGTRTVILMQGSPGNEEDVLGLGQEFASNGYNALTFDYSGTQRSGGLSSFANSQLDIAAAYRFLEGNDDLPMDKDRLVPGGWSYGGGMALTYAADHPEVTAVFSVAGTDHREFMREYIRGGDYRSLVDAIFDAMAAPDSPWHLAPGATPHEIAEGHMDIDPHDLWLAAAGLADRHLLLIGGWDDVNVKTDNHLLPLYGALRSQSAATCRSWLSRTVTGSRRYETSSPPRSSAGWITWSHDPRLTAIGIQRSPDATVYGRRSLHR